MLFLKCLFKVALSVKTVVVVICLLSPADIRKTNHFYYTDGEVGFGGEGWILKSFTTFGSPKSQVSIQENAGAAADGRLQLALRSFFQSGSRTRRQQWPWWSRQTWKAPWTWDSSSSPPPPPPPNLAAPIGNAQCRTLSTWRRSLSGKR